MTFSNRSFIIMAYSDLFDGSNSWQFELESVSSVSLEVIFPPFRFEI